MKRYEFWFIIGSQHLYGQETLDKVLDHGQTMVKDMNESMEFPWEIKLKGIVKTSEEIVDIVRQANNDDSCAGIISWMHTFSPSKMWIRGLSLLDKPYLHFNTQFNKEIPWDEIDMDFMNLNQSAHGDREHGFIGARMRFPRKIIVGHWKDTQTRIELSDWMRSAIGYDVSRNLNIARFGDNMRDVAVTEGDKVEAQIKFGWSVNYYPISDLVEYIDSVKESEVDSLYEEYLREYEIKTDNIDSIRYQARIELGMRRFLEEGNFQAFTTNFQDLHGLNQLPGLAVQRLMEAGYGFGAEGDWKTAGLTHIMKMMAIGLKGGTTFMEDYTYHVSEDTRAILGAHMLEICPSVASGKKTIDVKTLDIGGKEAPARLLFEGKEGPIILVSLVDMGGRMRMIVNEAVAIKPKHMPKLPVASVMWEPKPNLKTAINAWILAGGAHHTVVSYDLSVDQIKTLADLFEIEMIVINDNTDLYELEKELRYNDIYWRLNR